MRPVSLGAEVRFAGASFSQSRIGGRAMRRVSHADAHLHGHRCAPRSQHPDSASRPVGEARHSQRLHQLPQRQVGAVGVGHSEKMVRARARRVSAFRRDTRTRGSVGAPGAQQSLERLVADGEQPAIARATALSLLANYAPPPTDEAVRAGVGDDWALVRRAAAHAMSNTDPAASANAIGAAAQRSGSRGADRSGGSAGRLAREQFSAGCCRCSRSRHRRVHQRAAIERRPSRGAYESWDCCMRERIISTRPRRNSRRHCRSTRALRRRAVNLADLYRAQNRDDEGESVLKDAISRSPDDASLEHALRSADGASEAQCASARPAGGGCA